MRLGKRHADLKPADKPKGVVVAQDRLVLKLSGLDSAPIGAQVLFEGGQRGFVKSVGSEFVTVISLSQSEVPVGATAILESDVIKVPVGKELIGRLIDPLGSPLDGKKPLAAKQTREIFSAAPPISQRAELTDQLESGVMIVDSLFPLLLGQRVAVLGDYKTGKSTFLSQLVANQGKTGRVVIYVLIAKRRADIDRLMQQLRKNRAMAYTIVVATTIFDSLGMTYLAPFAACAMAEHLWQNGTDTIIIYDDLTNHAKAYRELSLLSGSLPARDSYPGDIFYTHSQLLERAGKLSTGASQTALPVAVTENDDITGYLPTNLMSMADGQLIFDKQTYNEGIRPAVNVGLSVSRVGGRAQSEQAKSLTQAIMKTLASWRRAKEFSQFSSELASQTETDLLLGNRLYEAFRQPPDKHFSLKKQAAILSRILERQR